MRKTIQYWKVDDTKDLNLLLTLGWELTQVLQDSAKEYKEHWFSVETIYHIETRYLMGCPEGIKPRKDTWESVKGYVERMKLIEEVKKNE